MKITRKSFMTGFSAAVLMDWTKLVFADGAPRPFGAGARILDGRIQRLLARALDHDVFPKPVKVEYDPADMSLSEPVRIGKRLAEYMAAQQGIMRDLKVKIIVFCACRGRRHEVTCVGM